MIYRSQFDKLIIEKKFGGIKEDPETGKITFINQITKKEHTDKARVPCPPAPDGYYSAEEVSLKYKVIIKHVQSLSFCVSEHLALTKIRESMYQKQN